MLGSIEILCENETLHQLLQCYRQQKKQKPEAQWHDRIMELEGVATDGLSKLHGTLIALGWIETRVTAEAFDVPGKVASSYRITNDGVRALHHYDHNLGLATAAVADENELDADEE